MTKRDPWLAESFRLIVAGAIFAALFFLSYFGLGAAHAYSHATNRPKQSMPCVESVAERAQVTRFIGVCDGSDPFSVGFHGPVIAAE